MVEKDLTVSDELVRRDRIRDDYELCQAVAAGDPEAGEAFYDKYHRLTSYFGLRALQGATDGVVDGDDMRQEAMVYALRSARRFTPDHDMPFASFLGGYIGHTLTAAVYAQRYGVHTPNDIFVMLRRIQGIDNARLQRGIPRMNDDKISEDFDILPGPANDERVTVGALRQAFGLTTHMGSLDRGFNPRADTSPDQDYDWDEIHSMTPVGGNQPKSPEDMALEEMMRVKIEEVLDSLTPREADIIRMRFGLTDGSPKILEECARKHNISHERVRQIEKKAMTKLRHASRIKVLEGLLD